MSDELIPYQPLLRWGRLRALAVAFAIVLITHHSSLITPAHAQDIHFSQIDLNPILLNPAYNGFFNGTGRLGITYRNQWATVGQAFQTYALSAEVSLLRRRRQRDGLSLGLWAYSDRAGALRYGSSAATAALSYYLALDRDGSLFLSGGVELGLGQNGFNPDAADLFDPAETLSPPAVRYPLLGTGLALHLQPNDDLCLKIGASGRNLNRPVVSCLGQEEARLERKLNLYARLEYRVWADVALLPVALLQMQRQNREAILGLDAKWYIAEGSNPLSLSAGLHYRWRDALYLQYTLEWNAFLLALAYDSNLSRLTPASHSVGAFELALVYRLAPRQTTKRKALPCPVI